MRCLLPLFFVLSTACTPEPQLTTLLLTFGNQSGYDFVYANVCFESVDEYDCVEFSDGVRDGVVAATSENFWGYYGDLLTIDAAAVDVDGDGYIWGPRTYVHDAVMDVSIVFTFDNCCHDF